ncbi:copper chaperone [Dokdonella sp.]|uniref:copper chaperone n=1 Tax=Dokdonella sp. TaxID=2291710 RepID=UPI003F7FB864
MLRLMAGVHGDGAGAALLPRPRRGTSWRPAFLVVVALLFATGVTTTVLGCLATAPQARPMPGGWMPSAAAMAMCGQDVGGSLFAFTAMWLAMTVAMMLPALAPALWRYAMLLDRARVRHVGRGVALAGAGYFTVWAVAGVVLHALGGFAGGSLLQRPAWSRAVPALCGAAVMLAGVLQFSAWKRHHLACCRAAFTGDVLERASFAFRDGARLGLHCNAACANLTIASLALGMMDLRVMALAAAAVTAERVAPRVADVTAVIGIALVGAGACFVGRAVA